MYDFEFEPNTVCVVSSHIFITCYKRNTSKSFKVDPTGLSISPLNTANISTFSNLQLPNSIFSSRLDRTEDHNSNTESYYSCLVATDIHSYDLSARVLNHFELHCLHDGQSNTRRLFIIKTYTPINGG